eukprot:TRINITY_DN5809_c0_g1_i1.p1 TRINITY_DN5809_c0_g1~~TRINITY_DN5809_c0_g1_i1.p1  ORF type:complete len:503 (+),score=128.95 TRINITY_DN5809_c0_g1_i1:3-1511(+)
MTDDVFHLILCVVILFVYYVIIYICVRALLMIRGVIFFFFKQKTAYEMLRSLVGSEMCIRDSHRCRMGRGKNKDKHKDKGDSWAANQKHQQTERLTKKELRAARKAAKYRYSASEDKRFREQLRDVGLRWTEMEGDGNCLFRAVADQMLGAPGQHTRLRQETVDYIEQERELYQWFVEDDMDFDTYCATMRRHGEWGGHMELQALSQSQGINIVIHHLNEPRWEMNNHTHPAHTVHLSHHQGSHYNSVRMLGDADTGVPMPIAIEAAPQPSGAPSELPIEVKMVMDGSGVRNLRTVEEALGWFSGDVDATILFLIEENQPEPDAVFCDASQMAPELTQDHQGSPGHGQVSQCPGPAADLIREYAVGCKNSGYFFGGQAPEVLRRACSSDCEDLLGGARVGSPKSSSELRIMSDAAMATQLQEDELDKTAVAAAPGEVAKPAVNPKGRGQPKKGGRNPPKMSNKERKEQKKREKALAAAILANYDKEEGKEEVADSTVASISI